MATTYTSTVEIKVWKGHTCCRCGQPYRYLFERKKKGQGRNPQAASVAAQKAVVAALAHEVDQQPCPTCGLYQPDMVAALRRRRHWYVFWLALLAVGVFLILAATEVMTLHAVATQVTMLGLVCLIAHAWIDRQDPNRDLEANRSEAERRIEGGRIWAPKGEPPTIPENAELPRAWTTGHLLAYCLLVLGIAFTSAPLLLRSVRGWTETPAWYPGVAGPGDEVHTYFPDKITSVKGYWNGTAHAVVENAAELGLPANAPLAAFTHTQTWPQQIKVGSRESKTSTHTLWAGVRVPNQPDLAGKTLQLSLHLQAKFPELQGNQYLNVTREYKHRASLTLSSPGCAAQYRAVFWWGVPGGSLLCVLLSACLAVLAGTFRGQALPTEIIQPTAPNEV